jgi:hypothetical protein
VDGVWTWQRSGRGPTRFLDLPTLEVRRSDLWFGNSVPQYARILPLEEQWQGAPETLEDSVTIGRVDAPVGADGLSQRAGYGPA